MDTNQEKAVPPGILGVQKLDPTFMLKVDGEDRAIKMTFGRLNRVAAVIGDSSEFAQLITNPTMTMAVLVELPSTQKQRVDIDELDIDPDNAANAVAWAGAHVLDFFAKLGATFNTATQPLIGRLADLAEQAKKAGDAINQG